MLRTYIKIWRGAKLGWILYVKMLCNVKKNLRSGEQCEMSGANYVRGSLSPLWMMNKPSTICLWLAKAGPGVYIIPSSAPQREVIYFCKRVFFFTVKTNWKYFEAYRDIRSTSHSPKGEAWHMVSCITSNHWSYQRESSCAINRLHNAKKKFSWLPTRSCKGEIS